MMQSSKEINQPQGEEGNKMSIAEVKEILCGTFNEESDRQYWIDKLAELEIKEINAKENKKYFKAMAKYAK